MECREGWKYIAERVIGRVMPAGRPSKYDYSSGGPFIYGLYDHKGALRYIGKANNPIQRLRGHMRRSVKGKSAMDQWLRENGSPFMEILEAGCVDWNEAERRLIREARERGENLLNIADGGNGSSGNCKPPYPQGVVDALAFSKAYSAAMANLGHPGKSVSTAIKNLIKAAEQQDAMTELGHYFSHMLTEWKELRASEEAIFERRRQRRKSRISAH